jgi:hypothetical protein
MAVLPISEGGENVVNCTVSIGAVNIRMRNDKDKMIVYVRKYLAQDLSARRYSVPTPMNATIGLREK